MPGAMFESEARGLPLLRRGKVRDVYRPSEEHLIIVAWDRISAFDHVLPTPIPDKGKILTQISNFWFEKSAHIVPNHIVEPESRSPLVPGAGSVLPGTRRPDGIGAGDQTAGDRGHRPRLPGRLRLEGVPEQRRRSAASRCRPGCSESSRLPEPIFTPSTKAEPAPRREHRLRARRRTRRRRNWRRRCADASLALYRERADYALERGIIIADTKFEFGPGPDGEPHPDRRGADAGFLALLAGRRYRAGPGPAELRQAVRPRLPGNPRAGTEPPGARTAPGGGGEDPGEVPGGRCGA